MTIPIHRDGEIAARVDRPAHPRGRRTEPSVLSIDQNCRDGVAGHAAD